MSDRLSAMVTAILQVESRLRNGRATILLIEDDSTAREALHEILNYEGYSVLPAENGKRALESVEATGTTPTLILLDLAMPVMDGVAFLSQVPNYARLASVPIIIMSADSRAFRLRAERPGKVMEVLPKPIDLCRMKELIRKHSSQASHGP
jgi:CheY-like chemotaxis protein